MDDASRRLKLPAIKKTTTAARKVRSSQRLKGKMYKSRFKNTFERPVVCSDSETSNNEDRDGAADMNNANSGMTGNMPKDIPAPSHTEAGTTPDIVTAGDKPTDQDDATGMNDADNSTTNEKNPQANENQLDMLATFNSVVANSIVKENVPKDIPATSHTEADNIPAPKDIPAPETHTEADNIPVEVTSGDKTTNSDRQGDPDDDFVDTPPGKLRKSAATKTPTRVTHQRVSQPYQPFTGERIRPKVGIDNLITLALGLNKEQQELVKKIGFGSIFGFKVKVVPTALAQWLVTNYDPNTGVLNVGGGRVVKITSELVNRVFGLPMGPTELVEKKKANKKKDLVVQEFRNQFDIDCK